MELTEQDLKDFESRIRRGHHWMWLGENTDGYPLAEVSGRFIMASHVALHTVGVEVPTGHQVKYLCSNKQCIKPTHLGLINLRSQFVRRAYKGVLS